MSSPAVRECAAGEIWLPGMTLDTLYPSPSAEDLIPLWEDYSEEPAIAVNGVLGVITPPKRKITDIVSIDLCEVIRESMQALHEVTGVSLSDPNTFYQDGTWYDRKIIGKERQEAINASVLQIVINNGLVKPVPYISAIRAAVKSWRGDGAFVVANTSTLPGCEPGTINRTLKDTMLACFDGIVFPYGYDNNSKISKSQALAFACRDAGVDYDNLPILHIDDSDGHHGAFRTSLSDRSDVTLLAPIVKGRQAPEAHVQFDAPYKAFLYAHMLRNGRLAA